MSEVARILDQLRRAWDGDAWHGTPLKGILAGVEAPAAHARPIPDAHTILENVLHLAYWKDAARRRVAGETVKPSDAEQWPVPAGTGEAAWREALRLLEDGQRRLDAAVAALSDADLDRPVPGMNYTVYVLLHGVVQHDLYHAGQIALLKKAAKARGA
jgi:uncharacterized damage-inducible protein DinB